MTTLVIAGLVLFVVAGIALWKRQAHIRRTDILFKSVPRSAAGVASAQPGEAVSVSGIARNERELISERTRTPCIYYDYSIVRRFEDCHNALPSGRNDRRSRRKKLARETVARYQRSVPFYIEDMSGRVRVEPAGASFDAREVLNSYEPEREGPDPLGAPATELSVGGGPRTLGHEFTEHIIPADTPVFVAGVVDENGQITCRNGRGENVGMIVSHRDEATLREDWERRERWQLYGAIGCASAGLLLWFVAAAQPI